MDRQSVVIVEDDPFRRSLMADLAECNDMSPIATTDLDRLDSVVRNPRSRRAVVVVDLDDPNGTGVKAVERLRTLPNELQPRIVGLAADPGGERSRRVRDLGLAEMLPLPIDTGSFARALKRQEQEAIRLEPA